MPGTEHTEQSHFRPSSASFKSHLGLICVCATCILLIALFFVIGTHFSYENTTFAVADPNNYLSLSIEDFSLKDDGSNCVIKTDLSRQSLTIDGTAILSWEIPEELRSRNTFSFETDCLHFRVLAAGKTVFESKITDHDTAGRYTGSRLVVFTLPESAAGQELTLEILSNQRCKFTSFSLSTQASFISDIYNSALPRLLLCAVFGIFFLIEILFRCIARKTTSKKNMYFSLLLFALSLWLLSDSNLPLLHFENGALVIYLSTFLFALLVPLFCLFLKEEFPAKRRVFTRMCIVFCFLLLLAAGLLFANLIKVFYFLVFCHLMLLVSFLTAIVFYFQHHKNQQSKEAALLLLIIALTAAAALVSFYFPLVRSDSYSNIVMIGMLLACAVNVITRAISSSKIFSDINRLNYYKRMAYTDYLTGLKNKAAYEKALKQWDSTDCHLAVIMFDSNNLKQINDRYGHESGDKLLRATAYCLTTSFGEEHTVYRVGGDEFIVLLAPKENEDIQQLVMDKLNKFNELVLRNNENSELKISIAYGYSIRQSGDSISAAQLAMSAEKIMYANKRASSKGRRRS